MWPDTALSLYDAQNLCSAQNAFVYTAHVIRPKPFKFHQYTLFSDRIKNFSLRHIVIPMSAEVSNNLIFGQLLALDSPQNILPSVIQSLYHDWKHEKDELLFFAYLNGSCNVVK